MLASFRPGLLVCAALTATYMVPAQPILVRSRPLASLRAEGEQAVANCRGNGQDRRSGPERFRGWQRLVLPRPIRIARLAPQARGFDRESHLLPLAFDERGWAG